MAIQEVQENQPAPRLKTSGSWVKGQTGNPRGRPRIVRSIQALARLNTDRAFRTILRCMKCGIPSTELAAAQEVLNRGWGKAPIKIDMEIQSFEHFSPEARVALDLICQLLLDQSERKLIEATPVIVEDDAEPQSSS